MYTRIYFHMYSGYRYMYDQDCSVICTTYTGQVVAQHPLLSAKCKGSECWRTSFHEDFIKRLRHELDQWFDNRSRKFNGHVITTTFTSSAFGFSWCDFVSIEAFWFWSNTFCAQQCRTEWTYSGGWYGCWRKRSRIGAGAGWRCAPCG